MIGGIAWVAAAVASLAAGALLVCPAGECRTLAFDEAALMLAQGWQASWLDAGFAALTWLGSLYVLIPLSLLLVGAALYAFFWAVDNDQFEDMETPALDILADDDKPVAPRGRER